MSVAVLGRHRELLQALDDLPAAIRSLRRTRGLSLRAAAVEVGISFSSLDRFERTAVSANLATVRAVLRWYAVQSLRVRLAAVLADEIADAQTQERTKEGEA